MEARIKELADTYGAKLGMDRRQFLRTSCGMAAAFVAMNKVFGNLFAVSDAEAADVVLAAARAETLKGQFIFDVQTHFVRDDFQQEGFLGFLKHGAEVWKNGLDPNKISLYDIKFENYIRQIYLNSDTSVAVLSGAPFDDTSWVFLSNEAIADAVRMVNKTAGSTRLLGHAVITPGQPGWMEEVDRTLAERPPASWKLYTIGDPLSAGTKHPFRLDDEKLCIWIWTNLNRRSATCVKQRKYVSGHRSGFTDGAAVSRMINRRTSSHEHDAGPSPAARRLRTELPTACREPRWRRIAR